MEMMPMWDSLPIQTSLLDDVPEVPLGRVCAICRSPVTAERVDARYCSVTCRVRAHRRRIKAHY